MNVGELKRLLNEFPEDTPVLLATDEEGNSFYRLSDISAEMFFTDSPHCIEQIWPTDEYLKTKEAKASGMDPDEDSAPPGTAKAFVLWP